MCVVGCATLGTTSHAAKCDRYSPESFPCCRLLCGVVLRSRIRSYGNNHQLGVLQIQQNVEITGLQASTVSRRQEGIRQVLEEELQVVDSFLAGAYSRNTMIAPLAEADVDIFVVLNTEYFHRHNAGHSGGQSGLLNLIKRVLWRTYTKAPGIKPNGQAITIRFSDYIVDVVPGFIRSGGD